MKTVIIHFTDEEGNKTQSFASSSMKTGLMDRIFDLAERGEKLDKKDVTVSEVKEFFKDLKSLILSVFQYKFSYDELNENVEQEELMRVFNEICESIGSQMKKN